MSDTGLVIVTTTAPSRAIAQRLARRIVASRLAACVQSWPIHSVYWWKGKTESSPEILLVCKTRRSLAGALEALIRDLHPYELPEVVVTPIRGGSAAYLDWISRETARGPAAPPRRLTFPPPGTKSSLSPKGPKAR